MQHQHKASIKAIIGLGNPGPKYFFTPHNIGFLVLDKLASLAQSAWIEKSNMQISRANLFGHDLLLVKPMTFMNSSGLVLPALKKQGINLSDIVVIHDEIDFPFGKIGIKNGGSARGHNGLRSIIEQAGADFLRIRCGVGRPDDSSLVGNFVTAPFQESKDQVETLIDDIINQLQKLLG